MRPACLIAVGRLPCAPDCARDAAAFALMYGAGLRRSEVAGLQLADYDAASGEIRLVGKGNKERKVYAINGGAAALNAWIAHRGKEAGADIAAVKDLAGHASTDTTARYDRRGERATQRVAAMIHVPYTSTLPLPLA